MANKYFVSYIAEVAIKFMGNEILDWQEVQLGEFEAESYYDVQIRAEEIIGKYSDQKVKDIYIRLIK